MVTSVTRLPIPDGYGGLDWDEMAFTFFRDTLFVPVEELDALRRSIEERLAERAAHRERNARQRRAYRAKQKAKRAEGEQRTRERIIDAAEYLHASLGPARTTVSAVADRAGVTRATVYRHFSDRRHGVPPV